MTPQEQRKLMARRTKTFITIFNSAFTQFAKAASRAAGRPVTFIIAVVIILAWALTGPVFDYSDTWQLVINTGTTIITFLMVFLIQNTQNRDAEAVQIKLDELIRAVGRAQNELIDLEEMDDEDLASIREDYLKLAKKARSNLRKLEKEKKKKGK